MNGFTWFLLSMVASWMAAVMLFTNEFSRLKAIHLMFWLRIVAFVLILPGLFIFQPPEDILFYVLVVLTVPIFIYSDLVTFGYAGSGGAGQVSRLMPLSVAVTFIAWLCVTPSLVSSYMADPARAAGIVVTLAAIIFFTLRLRQCPLNEQALRTLILPVFAAGIGVVLSKSALEIAGNLSGVYYYILVQCALMLACYMCLLHRPVLCRKIPDFELQSFLLSKKALLAGIVAGAAHVMHLATKGYAYMLVENPAYVAAVVLSSSVWILLIYKIIGKREDADLKPGFGIVFCAIILAILTSR